MRNIRFFRAAQALLLLCVLALAMPSGAAANLLISMGDDAGLNWTWQPPHALNGAMYTLVMSQAEADAIAKQLPLHLQASAFAGVDFSKQAALVAYLGEAPSGGYLVQLHSIQINGNQVWVNVNRRSPAADEVVTLMVSYPMVVKRISQADLPKQNFTVRFADQTGRLLASKNVAVATTQPTTVKLGKDSMLTWKWRVGKELPGATYALVTSEQDARTLAAQLPKQLRGYAFKGIDFKKQAAIVAYLGKAPNSGYAVDIHSATINGKQVQVKVSRRSPARNEVALPVVSYPMVVKSIAKTKLPVKPVVEFVDQKSAQLAVATVGTILHTVKPGQTLWYISWLYGVKMEDVMKANNLTLKSEITVGQVLRIPQA